MTKQYSSYLQQKGLTIVELMIALALSSFLLLGVFQIFTSNQQMTKVNKAFGRVQEAGRIGLELVTKDIRMAGFWGCAPESDIVNLLDKSDSDYDAASMDYEKVQGVSGNNDVGSLTISGITVKPDTDTLTLKGATSFKGVKLQPPYMTTSSASIHINKNVTTLPQGKILMISDCNGGDVFTNTATNTEKSGVITHNTGNNPATGAVNNGIKNLSHTYNGSAQIIVPFTKTFFIGNRTAGGGGSFSLYKEEDGNLSELIRNVTDLQITYGENTTGPDASGSNNVDTFNDASNVTDMMTVGSIKIALTAEGGTNEDNGSPLSRTYTSTTNIRNRTLQ